MKTNPIIPKPGSRNPAAKPKSPTAAKSKPSKDQTREPAIRLQRILVPADFSQESKKALHYAISLATQYQAEIHVIYVFEPAPYPGDMGYGPAILAVPNQAWEKRALARLKALAKPALQAGIAVHCQVLSGTAHYEITKSAGELKADLIIMGTHGYSGFAHAMLGSTAEKVIRHAHCPVLVVRKEERDFV